MRSWRDEFENILGHRDGEESGEWCARDCREEEVSSGLCVITPGFSPAAQRYESLGLPYLYQVRAAFEEGGRILNMLYDFHGANDVKLGGVMI